MHVRSKVTLDANALRALREGLAKTGRAEIQLGVFSSKNSRDDDGALGNADIGAVHEFGSKARNIPARSFLRMPMEAKMAKELKRLDIAKSVMRIGPIETMREIGHIAEGEVDKAFTTSGYGTWAPNSIRTVARKGSARPLIDTGKLRAAITSRVEKKGAKS